MSGVRGWGDEPQPRDEFKAKELPTLQAKYLSIKRAGKQPESKILAISHGGEARSAPACSSAGASAATALSSIS